MGADVRFLEGRVVERIEVVENGDVPAVGEQRIHEVAADEAGAAGHESVFHEGLSDLTSPFFFAFLRSPSCPSWL